MRTPTIHQRLPASGSSRGPATPAAGDTNGLSRRGWWLALATLVPLAAVSLVALGLRARRRPDTYEAWWQARDAARASDAAVRVPSQNGSTLFV